MRLLKKIVVLVISVCLLSIITTVFLVETKGMYQDTKYYRSYSGELHLKLNVYPEDMLQGDLTSGEGIIEL